MDPLEFKYLQLPISQLELMSQAERERICHRKAPYAEKQSVCGMMYKRLTSLCCKLKCVLHVIQALADAAVGWMKIRI